MQFCRDSFVVPLQVAFLIMISFILMSVSAQSYWVDSQSGSTAVGNYDFSHIWDICTDSSCPGTWEQLSQVNLPCIVIGEGADSFCSEQEPEFFCRRVSGGYSGWGPQNNMLNAYFAKNYCWNDGDYFFVGGLGTYKWAALRGSDGAWIDIEFKVGINSC